MGDAANVRRQPTGGRRASVELQALGGDALVSVCQRLSSTLRKLVKLEYVMGKELLRNALHALLEALAKKRLPSGEDGKLIGDGGGQRSKLQSALEEIDEWDADDDVRELGGDLDEEVKGRYSGDMGRSRGDMGEICGR